MSVVYINARNNMDKLIALGFKPHDVFGHDRMTLKLSTRYSLVYSPAKGAYGVETLILVDSDKMVAVALYIEGCLFDTVNRASLMFKE